MGPPERGRSSENFAGVTSPCRGETKTFCSSTELRTSGCTFYNWGGKPGLAVFDGKVRQYMN